MPVASIPAPTRSRGRAAVHSVEELLVLVAGVANAAAAAGRAQLAIEVSMPVFNAMKATTDASRGVSDPRTDPERTPTAQAIQARLSSAAGTGIPWPDIVAGALKPDRERGMWLAALTREEPRSDLTDELVIHALHYIAARRGVRSVVQRQYVQARERLLADASSHGDDESLLEWLLPTGNQILVYCDGWPNALKLAGLAPPPSAPATKPKPPPQPPGIPLAPMVALFAVLNDRWPSSATLLDFARRCHVRMQANPPGGMTPIREQAAELLRSVGISPPPPPKPLGKGKRLSYRYPVTGIPGAPRRRAGSGRLKSDRQAVSDHDQGETTRRLYDEERRAFAVLSLRVWLAGLAPSARRVRVAYVAWQVGSRWVSAGVFDNGLGGFAALKGAALRANAAVKRAGGDPLADALAKADAIRPEQPAGTPRRAPRRRDEPCEPVPAGAFSFADAVSTVLAGPFAEAQLTRQ